MADALRAFSSPRAGLAIEGTMIGWAQGISVRPGVTTSPVKILGNMYPERFEPVDTNCSGSFDYIHILTAPLRSLKRRGGTMGLWAGHFLETRDWVLYDPPDLVVMDLITKQAVLTIQGMVPEGQSWNLSQGGLMMVSCNFVATRALEHERSIVTPLV